MLPRHRAAWPLLTSYDRRVTTPSEPAIPSESATTHDHHGTIRLLGLLLAGVCAVAWAYLATVAATRQVFGPEPDLEPQDRLGVVMLWLTFTALVLGGALTGYLFMRGNGRTIQRALGLLTGDLAVLTLAMLGLVAVGALE